MKTGVEIKTLYTLYSYNPKTKKRTQLSGTFSNKLLTSGLNGPVAEQNDWFRYCYVGSDSTPTDANQTSLLAPVGASGNTFSTTFGAQANAPYYGWKRREFRIDDPAIANQNLSEVAFGWSPSELDPTISRALIRDINGDPTTITPLPGEMLDVVIEIRYYPPLADVTGVVNIDGNLYNYILRASIVNSSEWGRYIGNPIKASYLGGSWNAYDDDIGTILENPSGVASSPDSNITLTDGYVNNSFRVRFAKVDNGGSWDGLGNRLLRSLSVWTTAGIYQIQFDSQANPGFGVPKLTGDVMTPWFYLNWAEKV